MIGRPRRRSFPPQIRASIARVAARLLAQEPAQPAHNLKLSAGASVPRGFTSRPVSRRYGGGKWSEEGEALT